MILVFAYVNHGDGKNIGKSLIEKRLALNVNIKEVNTLYIENDQIKEKVEDLLIIKTRKELFDRIVEFLKDKSSEIISIKISDANKEFLDRLESETSIKKIKNA
ncbi:MAG: divalent cation tolerance protein CutA [Nanopusillaceae archaeon]